jgi:hypothetical protein
MLFLTAAALASLAFAERALSKSNSRLLKGRGWWVAEGVEEDEAHSNALWVVAFETR